MAKKINLALQGGGAHGAFAWGVLDRLLEGDEIDIAGISGTSAGALNGAAVTAALSAIPGRAGREAAQAQNASQLKRLEAFDPTKLSTADRIDYDVVLYQRRGSADVAKFDFGGSGYGPTPYVISQQSGAYQSTPTSSTPSIRSRPARMRKPICRGWRRSATNWPAIPIASRRTPPRA